MGLRGDGVAADHAAGAVEGNVAVEKPDADVVGHHVCRDHLHGCQRGDVGAHLIDDDGVAVPVRRVGIEVVGACEYIPADVLAFMTCHVYLWVPPGGTPSSALSAPEVPSS